MFNIFEKDLDPSFKTFSCSIIENVISPLHINYYAELVICKLGTLNMTVNSTKRILREGEGTLIHSFEPHEFNSKEKNTVMVYCFSPILFPDIMDNLKETEKSVGKISDDGLRYICYLSKKTLSYPENEAEIRLLLNCLLYEIPCVSTKPEREQTLAVCRGIAYLEQNYTESISLESLAKAIGVNKTYASHMFSKYLRGSTFIDVLNQIRIHHTIKLLKEMPVAVAALESGFGSVRQFNRIFKATTGKTPSEYKKYVTAECKSKIVLN